MAIFIANGLKLKSINLNSCDYIGLRLIISALVNNDDDNDEKDHRPYNRHDGTHQIPDKATLGCPIVFYVIQPGCLCVHVYIKIHAI